VGRWGAGEKLAVSLSPLPLCPSASSAPYPMPNALCPIKIYKGENP